MLSVLTHIRWPLSFSVLPERLATASTFTSVPETSLAPPSTETIPLRNTADPNCWAMNQHFSPPTSPSTSQLWAQMPQIPHP